MDYDDRVICKAEGHACLGTRSSGGWHHGCLVNPDLHDAADPI
jgi:hypothetical protein